MSNIARQYGLLRKEPLDPPAKVKKARAAAKKAASIKPAKRRKKGKT